MSFHATSSVVDKPVDIVKFPRLNFHMFGQIMNLLRTGHNYRASPLRSDVLTKPTFLSSLIVGTLVTFIILLLSVFWCAGCGYTLVQPHNHTGRIYTASPHVCVCAITNYTNHEFDYSRRYPSNRWARYITAWSQIKNFSVNLTDFADLGDSLL